MIKRKKRSEEDRKEALDKLYTRNLFFSSIWSKRPHKSEVSGEKIHGEILTVYFHHILPKNDYPQAEYDEENIILLTWQEHDQVEIDRFFYPEINRRRDLLKIKYNI